MLFSLIVTWQDGTHSAEHNHTAETLAAALKRLGEQFQHLAPGEAFTIKRIS